jgi:hypothetical protein
LFSFCFYGLNRFLIFQNVFSYVLVCVCQQWVPQPAAKTVIWAINLSVLACIHMKGRFLHMPYNSVLGSSHKTCVLIPSLSCVHHTQFLARLITRFFFIDVNYAQALRCTAGLDAGGFVS